MISREMVASFSWMKELVVRLRRWSLKTSLGRRYVNISSRSSEGRSRNDCGFGTGFFLDFFCRRFCMRSVFFEWSGKAAVVSTRGSSSSLSAVCVFFFGRFTTGWTECEVTMWYISSLLSAGVCIVVCSLLAAGVVIICSGRWVSRVALFCSMTCSGSTGWTNGQTNQQCKERRKCSVWNHVQVRRY